MTYTKEQVEESLKLVSQDKLREAFFSRAPTLSQIPLEEDVLYGDTEKKNLPRLANFSIIVIDLEKLDATNLDTTIQDTLFDAAAQMGRQWELAVTGRPTLPAGFAHAQAEAIDLTTHDKSGMAFATSGFDAKAVAVIPKGSDLTQWCLYSMASVPNIASPDLTGDSFQREDGRLEIRMRVWANVGPAGLTF